MVTGKAWTPEEVQIICMAYAKMLIMEQNTPPIKFNKSQIRREILPQLDGRSAATYPQHWQSVVLSGSRVTSR